MTIVFMGGAVSSAVTGAILPHDGWTGVALFATILIGLAGLVWCADRRVVHGAGREESGV